MEPTHPNFKIPTPPLRRSSSDLWFLSYLPLALSDGLSTPLIPLLAIAHYGLTSKPFVVTAIIAASTVFEVPCMILWGNLSDRVRHRKWFLVGSFAATGALLLLMSLPISIGNYFLLNLAEGIASAAGAPIGTVLLLETRTKRWWARDIGLFGLVSGLGAVLGLALGSVWFLLGATGAFSSAAAQLAMRYLIGVSGVLALASAGMATAWVEEPHALVHRWEIGDEHIRANGVIERMRRTRRRVLHIVELTKGLPAPVPRGEYAFLAALLVMSIGFQIFYGPLPVFLTAPLFSGGAALSQQWIFLVYLSSAATSTGLFYHSGLAVERASPKGVFILSLLARSALIPIFVFVPLLLGGKLLADSVALIALNGLMGVTWAFLSTASTLFLLRLARGPARGKALGWYNALAGLGGLAGTLWGGLLYQEYGVRTAFLSAAVVILIGTLILVPIRYHHNPFEPVPPEALGRRAGHKLGG